jgi:hypothetical protein
MTLRQMVEAYPLSRSTLYRLHHAGRLTIRKMGRRSVVNTADIELLAQSMPVLKRNGGDR